MSDTGATLRSPSSSRPIAADIGGKEWPPSASMTGLRAPLHASIDTAGIPVPAPAVTKLVVDKFSRDLGPTDSH